MKRDFISGTKNIFNPYAKHKAELVWWSKFAPKGSLTISVIYTKASYKAF